ncbi:MAG: phage tail protein [Citromicrobium sp.]|nr:phage tail protein [Citromicrobium sp.]
MQADIAAIFHWPLSELDAMTIPELLDWHARAVRVWNRMNRVEK